MIDSAIEDGKDPQNDQIAGFSVEFLLAGYDTTSTALSYTSYLLAMNTDVQERLQTEIDEFFEEHPEASLYEAAQKLKYLDMVIQESLRYYSPVPKTQRYCSKTVTVGNVTIPEGAEIIIPINLIHRSPTYWPDPYKFDPERYFSNTENKLLVQSSCFLLINKGSQMKQRLVDHSWLTCHLAGVHVTVLA
jgi:cytochrome P450